MSLSERESSPLSKQWLTGYWAYEGACSSELETAIWPDGTYTMGDGRGRWSLSGDSLIVQVDRPATVQMMQVRLGDEGTSSVRKVGANKLHVSWGSDSETDPSGTFFRCEDK
jgi:hypothetical protein